MQGHQSKGTAHAVWGRPTESIKCEGTGSATNNAPFLLQNLLLHNHTHALLQHNNITLKHTIGHFR